VSRERGTLAEWNDERGFGFVLPSAGGRRAFVHISAFPRGRRPAVGEEVTFVATQDERGRPRATAVEYAGRAAREATYGFLPALVVVAVFFAVLFGLVAWFDASPWLVPAYAVASAVTFGLYAGDKRAATRGEWRTPEDTLHVAALLGGWPGALIARRLFRHKTTKEPFRTIFWCTVFVNLLLLGVLVYARPLG
jgi:uncharacterized membrane protein YsdA (DUF1294 family)/cold shock CspA family protein